MEPLAQQKEDPFPLLVLRGGIEFTEWFAEWCERTEQSILAAADTTTTAEKRSS